MDSDSVKSYTLKNTPEDFRVDEIIDIPIKDRGEYTYVEATKEGLNTEQTAQILSNAFHINPKSIAYAGLKDKKAVTTQLFSLRHIQKHAIDNFRHPQLQLRMLGYGNEPIFTGSHTSNKFTIRVDFNDGDAMNKLNEGVLRLERNPFLVNYFDEQRFSRNNVLLGTFILKKKFKEACELIAREENGLEFKPFHEYHEQNPSDVVGALGKLPRTTLSLYVHAVQSAIFNNALSSMIKETENASDVKYSQGTLSFPLNVSVLEDISIPLVGFGYDKDTKAEKSIKREMEERGLGERDFIIRQFPEISCEGTLRKALVPITGFSVLESDETGARVTFILPKGSYATMVFKQIFLE